jgi:type IV pilus assembly protein PilO
MALPAFFDPILNLERKYKVIAGLVVLVVLVVVPWWFAIAPAQERVAKVDAQLKQLESEIMQQRAILAQLEGFKRQVAELEQRLAALTQKLPSERDMPPLYRTLSDAAVQTGLAVALFQPREARIRDYYAEIPISVSAEGGYHDLGQFFDRLAGLPRVVTVAEWKLTGLGRTRAPMRADLTLATYQYRPVGSPPAPKAGAKK